LPQIEEVICAEGPDIVLSQGDTTTAFVAGLAAFYQRVAVGHVEAGLRTGEKYEPFPEEMNRRLLSVLGDLHFAPTNVSRDNLLRENVPADRIFVTGNTVVDAVKSMAREDYRFALPELTQLNEYSGRVILATAHRRENWGGPLESIALALRELAETYEDIQIVFPVHKNPVVRETVYRLLEGVPRVILCEPLEYEVMANLLKCSYLVLTDSGGLQEEAPGFGRPVLVLRNVTERPEGVAAGTLRVIGTERNRVVAEAKRLLDDDKAYEMMSKAANPYGDGHAAQRTLDAIRYHFRGAGSRPPDYVAER
jgi:UDP-N-acetylglucosamine 2-epimerase (non-hydrolysing)